MSDDLKRKGPEDPKKINVNEKWELEYWCEMLGVTETELRNAVKAVGTLVVDVKKKLGK